MWEGILMFTEDSRSGESILPKKNLNKKERMEVFYDQ